MTVTNLGGIGGTQFTPIVNWPEVAILGVARAQWEPHYVNGKISALSSFMLPLSLSYDHRLIDGADGARFPAPGLRSHRTAFYDGLEEVGLVLSVMFYVLCLTF